MRLFTLACIVVATLYAATACAAWAFQRRLVFHPDARQPTPALGIAGLRVLSTGGPDGPHSTAWYVPAAHGSPTIAYLHGNAGNIGDREGRMQAFAQAGVGILMVEYPGYGGEPGAPSEPGLLEAGRRALGFLDAEGVRPRHIVLYGESIGTGVATRLATEHEVGGLVLESPYTSIRDLAQRAVPWLPVDLLLTDRFEQLSLVARVQAPLLLLQGARDQLVPPDMGRTVFEAANQPKRLWSAPQGGHNDLARFGAIAEAIAFARATARTADQPRAVMQGSRG